MESRRRSIPPIATLLLVLYISARLPVSEKPTLAGGTLTKRLSVSGIFLGMSSAEVRAHLGEPGDKDFPRPNTVTWSYGKGVLNITFGSHVPIGPVVSIQGAELELDGKTAITENQKLEDIVQGLAELGQPRIEGLYEPEVCAYNDGEAELRVYLNPEGTLGYLNVRRLSGEISPPGSE